MVLSARTTSRSRGPGDSNFTEKRRSLWPLICEPRPRQKRPSDAFWRSHAMWAVIIGLRGNATAMAVPSLRRVVAVAAMARGRNGSCWVSAPPSRDRKSTRLNSSHDQISYAVFCLKKKNDRLPPADLFHRYHGLIDLPLCNHSCFPRLSTDSCYYY